MSGLLICLAVIAFLAWLYFSRKGHTGLPVGAIVYDDAGRRHLDRSLVSHRYRLAGKPDYLIETREGLVPVELKSARCPRSGPYEAHIAQVLVYCLLVEDVLQRRVPYGMIHYADSQHQVLYTPAERTKILRLVDEIRAARSLPDVHRNHHHAGRCRGCGYRAICGEALP